MDRISLLFCKSCLKGDDNQEFYTILGIDDPSAADADAIKKAYKKISLSLHPDKLAQRGTQATPEQKAQFLKVHVYLILFMIIHICHICFYIFLNSFMYCFRRRKHTMFCQIPKDVVCMTTLELPVSN